MINVALAVPEPVLSYNNQGTRSHRANVVMKLSGL